MVLTDEQLMEIEARCDNATKGPWNFVKGDREDKSPAMITNFDYDDGEWYINGNISNDDDAEFIAHAREDVPRLIADLREIYDWWISANNQCGTLQNIIAHVDPEALDKAIAACNDELERGDADD